MADGIEDDVQAEFEEEEEECKSCGGERFVEAGPFCSKPASDCCGGCYQDVPCADCNADYENDFEPSYEQERAMRASFSRAKP